MARPYKGRRQRVTVRLPYDDYRRAAVRAQQRGWFLSEFIAWCVAVELSAHPDPRPRDKV